MPQDKLQQAKERYRDAKEAVREQHARIREDFRFSNPSEPDQWDDWARKNRAGRPMHTLDRTNQFIQHVVNKQRERKTSAELFPVDSQGDVEVAKRIKGIIRHIEYTSRADIAWDTAADHQARGGLGWVRITPKIVNPELNEQEILIQRVTDPLSICLDPDSTEPDGSDALFGFAESSLTERSFERQYKKAKKVNWDTEGWFGDDSVRIAEYFHVVEEKQNRISIAMPDGQKMSVTEKEYWELANQIGFQPQVEEQFVSTVRKVMWCKMTGEEILEETEYPSKWIGLIPVQGHELWVDGQRYLCGMVRRLMDGQRLHNYEMSALTESLMVQPKAPFLVPARAIDGREDEWQRLNSGNPAYLTYNDNDEIGPVVSPQRLSPPNFPVAYANAANLAVQEMESSVGMPKPVMGLQSNAISGRAKQSDVQAGETATFHFTDNMRVAKEHAYRVIVDMLPRIYSGRRIAKIMGEDDKQTSVMVDDELPTAVARQNGKVVAINLGVGNYDVRVKVGPSYTTIREEMGVKLQELGKGNPAMAAAFAPILMRLADMPEEAEKITRVAMAMLPPEVQKAYQDDDESEIPPAVKAQMQAHEQQIEKMGIAIKEAGSIIQGLQSQVEEKHAEVQNTAKLAKSEIDLQIQALNAQQETLNARKKALDDAARIASLELQLAQERALKMISDAQQKEDASEDESETETEDPQEDVQPLMVIAEAIARSNETLTEAIHNSAMMNAKMHEMTAGAMQNMAAAVSAPRQIQLQRDENGRPAGATSMMQ